MLTILGWGVAGIVLLNLVAMVSLGVSYAWHDGLRPKLEHRRASQRAFERLFAESALDQESAVSESSSAGKGREW